MHASHKKLNNIIFKTLYWFQDLQNIILQNILRIHEDLIIHLLQ